MGSVWGCEADGLALDAALVDDLGNLGLLVGARLFCDGRFWFCGWGTKEWGLGFGGERPALLVTEVMGPEEMPWRVSVARS